MGTNHEHSYYRWTYRLGMVKSVMEQNKVRGRRIEARAEKEERNAELNPMANSFESRVLERMAEVKRDGAISYHFSNAR